MFSQYSVEVTRKKGAQMGLVAMVAYVIVEYFQPQRSRSRSPYYRHVGDNVPHLAQRKTCRSEIGMRQETV
jgi:hypothetical protein